MEGRKQFTFYRSYYEALRKLPKCHRLGLVEAIMAYGLDGTEPEGLNGVQSAAFLLIQPTLKRGWKLAMGGSIGGSRSSGENIPAQASPKPPPSLRQALPLNPARERENEFENESENESEPETEDWAVGFERFWDLYPVKVGRDAALAAYREVMPDSQDLCRSVNEWLSSKQWKKENGRFIPRAAKFIRERHFDHVPPDCIPTGGTGYLGKAELEAIEQVMKEVRI